MYDRTTKNSSGRNRQNTGDKTLNMWACRNLKGLILPIAIAFLTIPVTAASIVLDTVTLPQLDSAHKDIANAMLFTTNSSGGALGRPFGFELGFIMGVGSRANLDKRLEESGGGEPLIPVLPSGVFNAGISLPASFTIDGNWRPTIALGGFRSGFYGVGLRWTISDILPIPVLNADIGASFSQGDLTYNQTLSSVKSNIDMDRDIIMAGATVGLNHKYFRPYVYLGYAKSDLTVSATNASSVFDASLSTTGSAKSDVESVVARAGMEVWFTSGNVGIEYQRAFDADRVTIKTSGRFPER